MLICVRIQDSEKALYYKAKGSHTWKEFLETGLFGDHKPDDVISYAEAEALIDQKIAEALAKK